MNELQWGHAAHVHAALSVLSKLTSNGLTLHGILIKTLATLSAMTGTSFAGQSFQRMASHADRMLLLVCLCRLELGSATTHDQIEQRLSQPLSPGRVGRAFSESLAAWRSYKRPASLPGKPLSTECIQLVPYSALASSSLYAARQSHVAAQLPNTLRSCACQAKLYFIQQVARYSVTCC